MTGRKPTRSDLDDWIGIFLERLGPVNDTRERYNKCLVIWDENKIQRGPGENGQNLKDELLIRFKDLCKLKALRIVDYVSCKEARKSSRAETNTGHLSFDNIENHSVSQSICYHCSWKRRRERSALRAWRRRRRERRALPVAESRTSQVTCSYRQRNFEKIGMAHQCGCTQRSTGVGQHSFCVPTVQDP